MVAFPLTFNTANKIAHGIMDNHVASTLARLPLPTKLRTAVLDPMTAPHGESAESFGGRVEHTMQKALTAMTANRRLLLG